MEYSIIAADQKANNPQQHTPGLESFFSCTLIFNGTSLAENPEVPRLEYLVVVTGRKVMFSWRLKVGGNVNWLIKGPENEKIVTSLLDMKETDQQVQGALLLEEMQLRIEEKMREHSIRPPMLWKFATSDQATFNLPKAA